MLRLRPSTLTRLLANPSHMGRGRALSRSLCAVAVLLSGAALWSAPPSPSSPHAAKNQERAADPGEGSLCIDCHTDEVDSYARTRMAHSMRVGGEEPAGVVEAHGTTIRMFSNKGGSWQTLATHEGQQTYHVDYVVGTGTHANGFVTVLANHLFQSPVAYYRRRGAYGLAPGYENEAEPDFIRPVTADCLFCHAGSFEAVPGTGNEYRQPPFSHLAIGCSRCHGPTASHLENPSAANIVNPASLEPAARDSICEQCHLKGLARVANPGKQVTDFVPGRPLEETFTIYRGETPVGTEPTFKVISQSEELALSKCKRTMGDRMWCGTCHDPHNEPTEPVAYYRAKCLTCHAKTAFASSHPPKTSNCISCHMPKREAQDGAHTVFTDHRIQRVAGHTVEAEPTRIVPWRAPPAEFADRNLGIASVEMGLQRGDSAQIINGYRDLTEVQHQFPEDSEMFESLGEALFVGHQYGEAAEAFHLAVRFDPGSSTKEGSLGATYAAMGQAAEAKEYLEKALAIDPLNLSAASLLMNIYKGTGEADKADQLSERLTKLLGTSANQNSPDSRPAAR